MSRPETLADAQRIVRVKLPGLEPGNLVQEYTADVRAAAKSMEGLGEGISSYLIAGAPSTGKYTNNRGPHIDYMLQVSGVGRRDENGRSIGGNWCGVGTSAACTIATPQKDPRFVPFVLHAGAKRVVKNLGAVGSFIVKPQIWTKWGSYKGTLDPERMEWALLVAWHRGFDPQTKWPGHVEIIAWYDPVTDTLYTWAPNVAPKTFQRIEMTNRLGIELVAKQAVWHLRVHAHGSWRRRLSCISTLEG